MFHTGDKHSSFGRRLLHLKGPAVIIAEKTGFKNLVIIISSYRRINIIRRTFAHDFKKQMEEMRGMENIEKEEDYLDWRFAVEATDRLNKQKLELENA